MSDHYVQYEYIVVKILISICQVILENKKIMFLEFFI